MAVKRPWRDICYPKQWKDAGSRDSDTLEHSSVNSYDEKVKFGRRKEYTLLEYFGEIYKALNEYHAIKKDDLGNFKIRAKKLLTLSNMADKFLRNFGIDLSYARIRTGGTINTWSSARLALTIRNRGRAKAHYLLRLKDFYKSESKWGTDPQKMLEFLEKAEKEQDDEKVGLEVGVLLEKLDPFHREFEVSLEFDDDTGKLTNIGAVNEISGALLFWFTSLSDHNLPFFVWMEASDIVKPQTGSDSAGNSVQYGVARIGEASETWLRWLVLGTSVFWSKLDKTALERADTSFITHSKSGPGFAAYVWTYEKHFFLAEHKPGNMHHSSFNGGEAVRCAGMMQIVNGKITHINNDSGHYRPTETHLRNLGMYLESKKAILPTTLFTFYRGSTLTTVDWTTFRTAWGFARARSSAPPRAAGFVMGAGRTPRGSGGS